MQQMIYVVNGATLPQNAWLGGFEPMLKCMSAGNYNWFLHTLLFYHTREVIRKQEMKSRVNEGESADDND